MPFEIEITKEYDGVSPKGFVSKKVDVPYYMIPKLFKEKRITLNGKKIKHETRLKEGDILKVWQKGLEPREIIKEEREARNLNMQTIFENEDFIVLNKLPEVVVQGAQHNEKSLSYHLEYLKQKNNDTTDFNYFHAHRLDKDTSGILVCGKNLIAVRELNKIFRQRDVIKKYVCLCIGKFKQKEGDVEVFMNRNPQGSSQKMAICKSDDFEARKSISHFKVLEEIDYEADILSLVEVRILTGITHQIRVHMKHLGHPIVGDKMYGNSYLNQQLEHQLNRQFLHAKSIEFDFNEKHYKFEAELTDDLKNFLDYIRN